MESPVLVTSTHPPLQKVRTEYPSYPMSTYTQLRVLAGPSLDKLTPIECNSDEHFEVKSDMFEGRLAIYIKDFASSNEHRSRRDSSYFTRRERTNVTWSIQAQGRYTKIYPEFVSSDLLQT